MRRLLRLIIYPLLHRTQFAPAGSLLLMSQAEYLKPPQSGEYRSGRQASEPTKPAHIEALADR